MGSLNASELWETARIDGFSSDYFLIDVLQYQLSANFTNLTDALNLLSSGSTNIHASFFTMLFGGGDGLEGSIIVNSMIVAILIMIAGNTFTRSIVLYILLSPYFIFYSIGWTKEILLTLSLVILIFNLNLRSKAKLITAFFFAFISRPQFLPILIISVFFAKIKDKYVYSFILIFLATSPFWLSIIPDVYYAAASLYNENNGGQGYSIYADYLKYNIPVFSILGYIFQIIKIYFEPVMSVIANASFYAINEIFLEVLFFAFLIRTKFCIFKDKVVKYLFITINVFIAALPFTHFRYLMPLLAALVLFNSTRGFNDGRS
ncbi:hypothetical protein ICN10_06310 [Polynucleobacter sp. 86C-FISCH]|uniref:hypothetical protein n=1 Tax=Polynucleobacter sp. 86C-FISCH TaxID=2689101 RepID=UPI001C0D9B5E|nr:hypothetical protein [Polynucleobacter sp. 86C-FISCH]MBU3596013.1 hypothetical protein [Polynucleobacter sp. 86C-FISCH]